MTHLSDLIAELRKGDGNGCERSNWLMQEAADALMANQGAIVNSIIERARHEATDDEREALLTEADTLVASWDQEGSWSSDSPVGMVMRLAAALRRSEVPEESAEDRIEQAIAYIRASWVGLGEPTPNTPAGAIIAILEGEPSFTEPQGEPSDADLGRAAWEAVHDHGAFRRDLPDAEYFQAVGAAVRAAGGAR